MTEYIENPLSGKLRGVTYEDGKIIDVHIMDTDDVVKVFVPMASEKEVLTMDFREKLVDLKPCPFCGGNVRFDEAYSYFRDIVIYCDSCDMVFTLDDCETTASEIADAWNRRADNG